MCFYAQVSSALIQRQCEFITVYKQCNVLRKVNFMCGGGNIFKLLKTTTARRRGSYSFVYITFLHGKEFSK